MGLESKWCLVEIEAVGEIISAYITARANQFATLRLRLTDVLDRVRASPDGAGRGSVVVPGDALGVQPIGEGRVFKAGVDSSRFVA